MTINIPKRFVKIILFMIQKINENLIVLVCKGYDDDYENYTAIYWIDDKDLSIDDNSYSDFQLWIKPQMAIKL